MVARRGILTPGLGMLTRRLALVLEVNVALIAAAPDRGVDPRRIRNPTPTWALTPLPWGAVRPTGWILDWADAARKGAVSPTQSWFASGTGKNGRSNGWKNGRPGWAQDEQSAYWIDGMMRLGLVLGDENLLARAREDVAAVIRNGYFTELHEKLVQGWPRSVYSRSMLAHFDATGDPKVLPFFESVWHDGYVMEVSPDARAVTQCEAMLEGYAFGGSQLLRDTCLKGLASNEAPFLHAWVEAPCNNFTSESPCFNNSFETQHGVTWNEVAKVWGIASGWMSQTPNKSTTYHQASVGAYKQLDARDMLPIGVNSAEEALSGVAPNTSVETCDVSDFIHSSTWLLRITGDGHHGDQMERAFHNAAPAAVDRDWRTHVYFQSPNLQKIPRDAYRLPGERYKMAESHDPACCTGNQARLLPNYIHHMWMGFEEGDGTLGLAATMFGPNVVRGTVGPTGSRVSIRVDVNTTYPFATSVRMKLYLESSVSVTFPLRLRIPAWCSSPTILVSGKAIVLDPTPQRFQTVRRVWASGDVVELDFPMTPVIDTGYTINNGGVTGSNLYGDGNRNNYVIGGLPYATVSLGPLLFALPLEKGGRWEYALNVSGPLRLVRGPLPSLPWDWPLDSPVKIIAPVRAIDWPDVWQLPSEPVKQPKSETTTVELVPYGCTKVFRVSMFPHTSPRTQLYV